MLLHLQNYDVPIRYHSGKEMFVANAFSHFAPPDVPEIPLDIPIDLAHITPQEKKEFQATICNDHLLCSLIDTTLTSWPEDIKDAPCPLYLYHANCDVLTVEDGLILHGKAFIIPPTEREKVLQAIYEGHLCITICQYNVQQCIYWHWINLDIKHTVEMCFVSTSLLTEAPSTNPSPRAPMAIPCCWLLLLWWVSVPFCHWILLQDSNYLQNTCYLKNMKIPESLWTDNDPQFANALFAEFATEWNFITMQVHQGIQAGAAVKLTKGFLWCAKYSAQDLYLALPAYHSTPIHTHLNTPATLLYQWALPHQSATTYLEHKPTCCSWSWPAW